MWVDCVEYKDAYILHVVVQCVYMTLQHWLLASGFFLCDNEERDRPTIESERRVIIVYCNTKRFFPLKMQVVIKNTNTLL